MLGDVAYVRANDSGSWAQRAASDVSPGLAPTNPTVLVRFLPIQMFNSQVAVHVIQLLIVFASVNICLAIFNLIPLYPLDGYQILYTLLPSRQAVQFAKSAPYGPLIILALFFLLPFLAQIASPGLSSFPLFQLPFYVWLGSVNIIALVMGQIPDFIILLYTLK